MSVAVRSVNASSTFTGMPKSAVSASQWRSRMPGLRSDVTTGKKGRNTSISALICLAMLPTGESLKVFVALAITRELFV